MTRSARAHPRAIRRALTAGLAGMAIAAGTASAQSQRPPATDAVALGRYVLKTAGCNDCHTPGYVQSNGNVAEKDWLTGDILGWRGPWGTTYATNLRIYFAGLTEDQWIKTARTMEPRPPMPWFNVRAMADEDLRAIYAYMKHMGSAGKPAPAYVPPNQQPKPPFVQFP